MGKGTLGDWLKGDLVDDGGKQALILSVKTVDATGAAQGTVANPLVVTGGSSGNPVLPAGTDRSGSATPAASVLAAANSSRTFLVGQNVDPSITIWINETGGTATANGTGSYKVIAGQSFSISTNRAISVIAESGNPKFTATEG